MRDNLKIQGGTYNGATGLSEFFRVYGGGYNDIELRSVKITAQTGTAFHVNQDQCNNLRLIGVDISALSGYGFLANSGSNNSYGTTIALSNIYGTSDAIEMNYPAGDSGDVIITGNTIKADGVGGSLSSGFAVGIAGAQYHLTSNNIINGSRNEAYHLEDKQIGGVFNSNIGHGLNSHGIHIQAPVGGNANCDGLVVTW